MLITSKFLYVNYSSIFIICNILRNILIFKFQENICNGIIFYGSLILYLFGVTPTFFYNIEFYN